MLTFYLHLSALEENATNKNPLKDVPSREKIMKAAAQHCYDKTQFADAAKLFQHAGYIELLSFLTGTSLRHNL